MHNRNFGGPVGNRNPASLRAREDGVTYALAQINNPRFLHFV